MRGALVRLVTHPEPIHRARPGSGWPVIRLESVNPCRLVVPYSRGRSSDRRHLSFRPAALLCEEIVPYDSQLEQLHLQGRSGKLVIPDQLIQLKGVADGMHDSVL